MKTTVIAIVLLIAVNLVYLVRKINKKLKYTNGGAVDGMKVATPLELMLKGTGRRRAVALAVKDVKELDRDNFVLGLVRLLEHFQDLFCTASIIHPYWSITAASCVVDPLTQEDMMRALVILRGGTSHIQLDTGFSHRIVSFKIHDKYMKDEGFNVALLAVKDPFTNYREQSIGLTKFHKNLYKHGSLAVAYGWGPQVHEGNLLPAIQRVDVTLMDFRSCKEHLHQHHTNKTLKLPNISKVSMCSITSGELCNVDVGGAVVKKDVLIGVSSWTPICGDNYSLVVYTKIERMDQWLSEVTQRKLKFINDVAYERKWF